MKTIIFWIASLAILFVWVLLSGIGGFAYQQNDYMTRNAMYRDLINEKLPLIADFNHQDQLIKDHFNSSSALVVYYITFYMVPSTLSKIVKLLGISNEIKELIYNALLFVWAYTGVLLIYIHLVKYFKKKSYWIITLLIGSSGADIIPWLIFGKSWGIEITFDIHLDPWCKLLCYSANTSAIYSVFNQVIPVWLIIIVILNSKNERYNIVIASLCFAYSP